MTSKLQKSKQPLSNGKGSNLQKIKQSLSKDIGASKTISKLEKIKLPPISKDKEKISKPCQICLNKVTLKEYHKLSCGHLCCTYCLNGIVKAGLSEKSTV